MKLALDRFLARREEIIFAERDVRVGFDWVSALSASAERMIEGAAAPLMGPVASELPVRQVDGSLYGGAYRIASGAGLPGVSTSIVAAIAGRPDADPSVVMHGVGHCLKREAKGFEERQRKVAVDLIAYQGAARKTLSTCDIPSRFSSEVWNGLALDCAQAISEHEEFTDDPEFSFVATQYFEFLVGEVTAEEFVRDMERQWFLRTQVAAEFPAEWLANNNGGDHAH